MIRSKAFSALFNILGFVCLLFAGSGAWAGALGEKYLIAPDSLAGECSIAANGDRAYGVWASGPNHAAYINRFDANRNPLPPFPLGGTLARDRVGGSGVVEASVLDAQQNLAFFATIFNRDGSIRINRFRVNEVARVGFGAARLDMNRNGDFVVSWVSVFKTGSGTLQDPNRQIYSLWIKRFDASGQALGPELFVGSGANGFFGGQALIDEGMNTVVYYGIPNVNNDIEAYVRRIDRFGNLVVNAVVSPFPMRLTDIGKMSRNSAGNYVIAWTGLAPNAVNTSPGVYTRSIGADGVVGSVIEISPQMPGGGHRDGLGVAMFDDDSYQVVWAEASPLVGGTNHLKSRLVRNLAGTVLDQEAVVTSSATSFLAYPDVCSDRNGSYTVVWRETSSGKRDAYGRDFLADNHPPSTTFNGSARFDQLSNSAASWQYFKVIVPDNASSLEIKLTPGVGASGDANLYISYGSLPTLTRYDIRQNLAGNSESVFITNPPVGAFFIGVYGNTNYKGVSLLVSVNGVAPPPPPPPPPLSPAVIMSIINNLLLN